MMKVQKFGHFLVVATPERNRVQVLTSAIVGPRLVQTQGS